MEVQVNCASKKWSQAHVHFFETASLRMLRRRCVLMCTSCPGKSPQEAGCFKRSLEKGLDCRVGDGKPDCVAAKLRVKIHATASRPGLETGDGRSKLQVMSAILPVKSLKEAGCFGKSLGTRSFGCGERACAATWLVAGCRAILDARCSIRCRAEVICKDLLMVVEWYS